MAIDYRRMQKTASRLVGNAGRDYAVTRPGAVTVVKGREVTQPDVTLVATGVRTSFSLHEVDGERVQQGDIRIVFTADVPLQVGDLVMVDGQQYRIQDPNPVQPADEVICYRAHLR